MCNATHFPVNLIPEISAKDIVEELDSMHHSQQISDEYWRPIYENIFADVLNDVRECADSVKWTHDDVLLAVGRVLLERLKLLSEVTSNGKCLQQRDN